ncbi:MAG TPA: DUF5615 family PIN-like protein [Flavobacteriales bacterium]|nr:DUF5615 family PIN-like protein [Flavobacteriales bacterium]HRP81407.1 DUF5615 family PIN-like protein [Flavobacteriales bacterium]HRQ84530.1 DUF5615 family PIN-like protein [Flavobacteriales bacterium]
MKFLIDENLSDKLVPGLDQHFPGTRHVKQLDLAHQPDSTVWSMAKQEGFIILTQDDDFTEMSLLNGFPPKVVHLAMGNHSTRDWLRIILANVHLCKLFGKNNESGLLVIK